MWWRETVGVEERSGGSGRSVRLCSSPWPFFHICRYRIAAEVASDWECHKEMFIVSEVLWLLCVCEVDGPAVLSASK